MSDLAKKIFVRVISDPDFIQSDADLPEESLVEWAAEWSIRAAALFERSLSKKKLSPSQVSRAERSGLDPYDPKSLFVLLDQLDAVSDCESGCEKCREEVKVTTGDITSDSCMESDHRCPCDRSL